MADTPNPSARQPLKPCPFCGGAVQPAFENLMDDPDDEEEVVTVWTMAHKCPVLGNTIWCQGVDADECHAAWNRRSGDST